MGGGLGGGSSDAATTLVALNHIWRCELSLQSLAEIGLKLGADVPVFVMGHAAWAEGVGEKLTAFTPPTPWYLVVDPGVHVSTAELFSDPELTRDSKIITISSFLSGEVSNVCQVVVEKRYPAVAAAAKWLSQFGKAQLTGTGGCILCHSRPKLKQTG
jgi:4-diphosphocytidyl-2-C-methyl-D-erythritol kinase